MTDDLVMLAIFAWLVRLLYKTFVEPGWKKSKTYMDWHYGQKTE